LFFCGLANALHGSCLGFRNPGSHGNAASGP
jgi:hypothetical protein